MIEHAFKTSFDNHNLSLNHEKRSAKTTLSKYVWELKACKVDFSIKWSAFCILTADKQLSLLNRRSELIFKCKQVLCRKPQVDLD